MKLLLLVTTLIFLQGCSKPKTVLICGDHICVNKSEAQQYFEENLTLEVKIVNKAKKKNIDLIELNLREGISGNKEIAILSKKTTKKKLKVLSNEEINRIKKNIKKKKDSRKIKKKIEDIQIDKKHNSSNKINKKTISKKKIDVYDVCTKLENCNIEEISKYLIKKGNKKSFPDITTKQ